MLLWGIKLEMEETSPKKAEGQTPLKFSGLLNTQ